MEKDERYQETYQKLFKIEQEKAILRGEYRTKKISKEDFEEKTNELNTLKKAICSAYNTVKGRK